MKMKYFTKQLYQCLKLSKGMTPEEEERQLDEGERLLKTALREYQTYAAGIRLSLPESVQRFLDYEFHDSMISSVVHNEDNSLRLELNSHGLPWIEGDYYWLTFFNIRWVVGIEDVIKDEYRWLYDEVYLSEQSAFELHVLCGAIDYQIVTSESLGLSEFRIAADDLQIERKV